jgi:hypothetical protein
MIARRVKRQVLDIARAARVKGRQNCWLRAIKQIHERIVQIARAKRGHEDRRLAGGA